MNAQPAKADAALRVRIEGHRGQIGDEIDHAILELARLQFAAEKIFLPGEAIGKLVRSAEDEVSRGKKVHHQRQIVRGRQTYRLAGRTVEVLVPDIKRRREEAPGLPLKQDRLLL